MKKTNLLAFIVALAVFLPTGALAQWTPPTQSPPNGNTAAPINTSSTGQSKAGGLILNTGGATNGLIVSSGNVGIGTVSPGYKFEILGSDSANPMLNVINNGAGAYVPTFEGIAPNLTAGQNTYMALGRSRSTYNQFSLGFTYAGNSSTNNRLDINAYGSSPLMTILASGNVGVGAIAPAYKLDVNGPVQATIYYYSSDRSLKKDIAPLSGALKKVMSMKGVSFTWKDGGKKSVGLIAQDVEKVYPEAVSTSPTTGLKSVEYGNLVAPLIEALREQQGQIDDLKREIEALKKSSSD